jgi:hypothetical protein
MSERRGSAQKTVETPIAASAVSMGELRPRARKLLSAGKTAKHVPFDQKALCFLAVLRSGDSVTYSFLLIFVVCRVVSYEVNFWFLLRIC